MGKPTVQGGELLAAADAAKALANKLRAIVDLAAVLEKLGSVEQATGEIEKRKAEAEQALATVTLAVSKKNAELEALGGTMAELRKAAEVEIAEYVQTKKAEADATQDRLLANARARNEEAERRLKELDAKVRARLADAEGQVNAKLKAAEETDTRLSAATAELARVNEKLEAARKQIKALLGGSTEEV